MPLSPIEDAIADIRAGKMVIVMDDEDRENEGDLTMAAQMLTPDAVFDRYGRGLICVSSSASASTNYIPMMVNDTLRLRRRSPSHQARGRTTTGISAFDRAATVAAPRSGVDGGRLPSAGHVSIAREGRARACGPDQRRSIPARRRPHPAGVICGSSTARFQCGRRSRVRRAPRRSSRRSRI